MVLNIFHNYQFLLSFLVLMCVMHYHIAVRQDVNDSSLIEEKKEKIPKAEKSKNDKTYKLEVTNQPKFTLEKRLFHELHTHDIHSLTIKEFKEC